MLANKARRTLITIGKMIPFVLCFIVSIAYLETIYALFFEQYLYFWDCTILNTPISFYIGNIMEYDLLVCIVTLIIDIAIGPVNGTCGRRFTFSFILRKNPTLILNSIFGKYTSLQ